MNRWTYSQEAGRADDTLVLEDGHRVVAVKRGEPIAVLDAHRERRCIGEPRAIRATIAFLESDRPTEPRADDPYGDARLVSGSGRPRVLCHEPSSCG